MRQKSVFKKVFSNNGLKFSFKIKFRPIIVVAVVVFMEKDATCNEFIVVVVVVVVVVEIVVKTGKEEGLEKEYKALQYPYGAIHINQDTLRGAGEVYGTVATNVTRGREGVSQSVFLNF